MHLAHSFLFGTLLLLPITYKCVGLTWASLSYKCAPQKNGPRFRSYGRLFMQPFGTLTRRSSLRTVFTWVSNTYCVGGRRATGRWLSSWDLWGVQIVLSIIERLLSGAASDIGVIKSWFWNKIPFRDRPVTRKEELLQRASEWELLYSFYRYMENQWLCI